MGDVSTIDPVVFVRLHFRLLDGHQFLQLSFDLYLFRRHESSSLESFEDDEQEERNPSTRHRELGGHCHWSSHVGLRTPLMATLTTIVMLTESVSLHDSSFEPNQNRSDHAAAPNIVL